MMISVIEHTTAPIQASAGLYGLDRTMALSQWQWGPRGALILPPPGIEAASVRGRSVVEAPGGVSPAGAALGKATPPPGPAAASTLPRRRGGVHAQADWHWQPTQRLGGAHIAGPGGTLHHRDPTSTGHVGFISRPKRCWHQVPSNRHKLTSKQFLL